jgi:energy-coupling factor transporter ATP-binding protein EcfA2
VAIRQDEHRMPTPRNLLNLKAVEKGYGSRSVLRDVTLGVSAGERIGVVGRNGDGKSTLLRLIAGVELPDAGALTRPGDVDVALLGQRDELDERRTIRETLVGARADHEWAGDSAFRSVLDGLMGGVALRLFSEGIDTPIVVCREGSVGASPWRACCSTRPSCCCWMSRPTTWTSKASTGWPATWLRDGARCSW